MIKTEYICDKCGHSQDIGDQMWEMAVRFTHYCSDHYPGNEKKSLWCRMCVEKLGLLPGIGDTGKMEVVMSTDEMLVDVANTLVTWRLIKTAPRDGTSILGFAYPIAEVPAVCWWEKCPIEIIRAGIEPWQWQTKEAGDFNSDKDWAEHWSEIRYEPTYWMHLPKPPRED